MLHCFTSHSAAGVCTADPGWREERSLERTVRGQVSRVPHQLQLHRQTGDSEPRRRLHP